MDRVYGRYTGPEWPPKRYAEGKGRYLWTDAFGVVNFISLWKATEEDTYLKQVLYRNEGAAVQHSCHKRLSCLGANNSWVGRSG